MKLCYSIQFKNYEVQILNLTSEHLLTFLRSRFAPSLKGKNDFMNALIAIFGFNRDKICTKSE